MVPVRFPSRRGWASLKSILYRVHSRSADISSHRGQPWWLASFTGVTS